jgi:hypothetical protein
MGTTHSEVLVLSRTQTDIKAYLDHVTNDLLASLPPAGQLSASERRGIIARYCAVLEGNFIYWMTGAYLAARSEEARSIIMENLLEEVRDSHPLMLRKFAMAANAVPNDVDALAVYPNLSEVRLFIGRLSPVPIVAMMAFFESFIQRFMAYLEELAEKQGSAENEYTQVHGVCDIAHSEGLFRGLEAEMVLSPDSREPADYLFEGVHLLRALIESVFTDQATVSVAA